MTAKGGLALVLLGVMGAAWWWTLSQPAVRGLPVGTTARGAAPREATAPAVALARLRRQTPPSVEDGGRDPFGGASVVQTADVLRDAMRTGAMSLQDEGPVVEPAARWPRVVLIGIARQGPADASTPVAVLSGERGVVHARAGELVAGVYRVELVGQDRVELTLVPEARPITLRLR